MPRTIRIHVPMIPKGTAQMKGHRYVPGKGGKKGHVQQYTKKEAAEPLEALIAAIMAHRPEVPLRAPISASWTFVYPWTKEQRSTKAKAEQCDLVGADWKITVPDTDNIIKYLKDRLQDLQFYENDSHIALERMQKFHGDRVGVWIVLSEMEFRRVGATR